MAYAIKWTNKTLPGTEYLKRWAGEKAGWIWGPREKAKPFKSRSDAQRTADLWGSGRAKVVRLS